MTTRNSGSSRSSGGGADSKRYSSSNVSPTPRWKQTPPQMKAPIQMDFAKNPLNKLWKVNSDPAKLDAAYDRLLGPGGSRLLPEELKWLAVTHKSFDQGRRGFNDKLALTGRMALVMEVTKDVVSRPPLGPAAAAAAPATDEFGREPFAHPQLRSVDNLFFRTPLHVVGKDKLSLLAERVGLSEVIRWKPRKPGSLDASGIDVVLTGAMYAIIGAITLQHGLEVANKVLREKILPELPSEDK